MSVDPAEIVVWDGTTGDLGPWSTTAAEGCRSRLVVAPGPGGMALGLDFGLEGAGAWAIARRELAATLPPHWVAVLRWRGTGSPIQLQVKLVDAGGANVWWWRRDVTPAPEPAALALRRAALEFAWGPRGGGEPERLGAVEVAVAAAAGGSGTLWIDDLRIEPRPPGGGPPVARRVRASSCADRHEPAQVLDESGGVAWVPADTDAQPWLELDLGSRREWGGLAVRFRTPAPPTRLLVSDDRAAWVPVLDDPGGPASLRWLRIEAESRFARLEVPPGAAGAIVRIAIVPIDLAASPARWAAAVAGARPRGRYPRHLLGEQAVWAVVGSDGDARKGLLGEDGAVEVAAESFTIEPFLWVDGRLVTWADVRHDAALAAGGLPIPSVSWTTGDISLRVTACAAGAAGRSTLVVRYDVAAGQGARAARLFVAIRPFQVMPRWQGLNLTGAVAPIMRIARDGARVSVDGSRDVIAVTAPAGFGAAAGGEGLATLIAGGLPPDEGADDPLGFAEGAFAFDLELAAARPESVVVAVPLWGETAAPPAGLAAGAAVAWGDARIAETCATWRNRLAVVPIALPPVAAAFEESLRASLGWILVNREGPRIHPGARAYRRAWIRDGAITAATLAEMGFAREAKDFLRWYAPHQHDDGRVPCAVDARGVDQTVEHDSHGELAWGIVEVFRLTGDLAFLGALWPHVRRAAEAIERLRSARAEDAGLLPPSISHEGYAGRPVHSFWDDFFGLCGLGAAAQAARALGEEGEARRFAAARDAMRRAVCDAISRTQRRHGLDVLPASVELGDFDAASTAIAVDPCREDAHLPRPVLERTFERWWREFEARRQEGTGGVAYTPYDVRIATALLSLGWKDRALELLRWLIGEQWPPAWRQWPEVAHPDRRAPRFLGDLPHGWVAASFVRAVRRLIAWELPAHDALVVAAGIPEAWLSEPPGVVVRGLPTHFGALDLALRAEADDRVRITIGTVRPPGGIVVESPLGRPLRGVDVDGPGPHRVDGQRVHLAGGPAAVVLRY